MNLPFVVEEINISRILPGVISGNFFLYNLPIITLLGYSLTLRNYISIIYVILGLILLNLQVEKYFKSRKHTEVKNGGPDIELEDIIIFRNFKALIYSLIFGYAVVIYILKFAALCLAYFSPSQYTSIYNTLSLAHFEVYFQLEFSAVNIALTFFPNLAIIIVIGSVLLFNSIREKRVINRRKEANQRSILKYVFKPVIAILTFSLPITNLSGVSAAFVTVNIAFGTYWSIRGMTKGIFENYCKTIQVLSALTVIINYLVLVGAIPYNSTSSGVLTIILGENYFGNFFKSYYSAIYVLSLFLLMLMATLFLDMKKTARMWKIYFKEVEEAGQAQLKIEPKSMNDSEVMNLEDPEKGKEDELSPKPKTEENMSITKSRRSTMRRRTTTTRSRLLSKLRLEDFETDQEKRMRKLKEGFKGFKMVKFF